MKTVSKCISCACDDNHACDDGLGGGCSWLVVDRALGVGVCSCCPQARERWKSADRRVRGLFVLKTKRARLPEWLCDSTATLQQPNLTTEERFARRYSSHGVAAGVRKKLGNRFKVDLTEIRT